MRRLFAFAVIAFAFAFVTAAYADTEYPVTLTGCAVIGSSSTCQGSISTGEGSFTAHFSTPSGFDELYIHNNGLRALDASGDTSINELLIDLSGASFSDLLGSIIGTSANVKTDFSVFITTVNDPGGFTIAYHLDPNSDGVTPIAFYAPSGDAFTSIQLGVGGEQDTTAARFFGFDDISFSGPATVTSVPEPASMFLFGSGLLIGGTTLRKRFGDRS